MCKESGTGPQWVIVRFGGIGPPPGTAVNQLWLWAGTIWTLLDGPTAFGQRLSCSDDGSGNKVLTWQDAQALSEIFTDDFNQSDGSLEKRWSHTGGGTEAGVSYRDRAIITRLAY